MVRRAQSDNHGARARGARLRGIGCPAALLCANLAIGSTNPPTRSFPMAAAKKSSRSKGGRKRSRSGSSGRKRGGARKRSAKRGSGSARKSPRRKSSARRKSSGRKSSARKSGRKGGGRKSSGRTRSRRRAQSPVARVKRVATGVVHQAADLGERAVDTVTEFVQDRF